MTRARLSEVYESTMKTTENFVAQFPWHEKQAYAYWLAQSYFFVRHSTRLLALAAGYMGHDNEKLHRRMVDHLKEESGHDNLALMDLRAMGLNINDMMELPETRAFYQSQYYWIQQRSAAVFLGYVIFLEGLAATQGPKILSISEAAFGKSAVRFLRVHAEEDQDHIQKAFDSLSGLSDTTIADIVTNMQTSCALYESMLIRVRAIAQQSQMTQVSRVILEPANI